MINIAFITEKIYNLEGGEMKGKGGVICQKPAFIIKILICNTFYKCK